MEKGFFPNNFSYKEIDTSLDNIQKYFPNNFPYSLGLSNRKLFFESSSEIGFRSGFDNLDLFGYNRNEIKYYNTRTPYTEIFALFGQKKEQYARLLHTQNITKQWNIALNMLRLHSEGFYNRQNCTDNNISLSSNYTSKNNRYSFLANGILSSVKTDENGGLRGDTIFESNLFGNKKLVSVNLLDARTRRGNKEMTVRQFVNFGKRISQSNDSLIHSIEPKHFFSYSFSAGDNWFVYSEASPDSGFYENVFFDTILTLDSTHVSSFSNTFAIKSYVVKNISAEISFEQKTSHFIQYSTDSVLARDTLFSDNIVHFEIGNNILDKSPKGFYWKWDLQNIVSGSYQGDYFTHTNLAYIFKNKQRISFSSSTCYHEVPFIYEFYSSNHFLWGNSFDRETVEKIKLSFSDPKHKFILRGEKTRIANYVYLDSTCTPVKSRGSDYFVLYSVFLQKNFCIKHFGFNNNIIWQSFKVPISIVYEDAVHVPEFVTNHSLYYKGAWFKGATNVQIGFDVTYFSSYFADAYMPAQGLYYLQNEKKIGNYPFIDFFFNMKIKHARIFFKTEHVNSGLMGAYYLAPHIPAPDRSFKVGINWIFYN